MWEKNWLPTTTHQASLCEFAEFPTHPCSLWKLTLSCGCGGTLTKKLKSEIKMSVNYFTLRIVHEPFSAPIPDLEFLSVRVSL